jgi:hypothetical protein
MIPIQWPVVAEDQPTGGAAALCTRSSPASADRVRDNEPRELSSRAGMLQRRFGYSATEMIGEWIRRPILADRARFERAAVDSAHRRCGRQIATKRSPVPDTRPMELATKSFQHITHPDDLASDLGRVKLARAKVGQACQRKDGAIVWRGRPTGRVPKRDLS